MPGVVLEVAVSDPRDVAGAAEGGADRLHVGAPGPTCALSPEPALVSAICRESDLPVFVLLRLNDSWSTTGGEFARLIGLGEDYLACGAAGVSFGFLDADLEIDTETCSMLLGRLPQVPWTFHRAIDSSLDPRRSWRRLVQLPRLLAVRSAGSPRGMESGFEDLLALVTPELAPLMMPGGGLAAEHVPWLLDAGVRQLHLGDQVRPGGSAKAYVDAGYVRSWRSMADDLSGESR
ncbi:MAG TPA: copper homeostasis protein CutC [Nocardioides sp.]|jgi:copper homeostasis protein|uniref:copper homeostasis protein CutC n=1 Tax=Nocardioides sp. TaxID=35761 RepID=UPI002E309119|nr:copper homeostasis protein CutC [Nocardioides sp.]HEX3929973.1 copper homeostasis protein CutC [Nocardioides sp.]